ncbi:MAG: HD domain-containing protein [Anaerolineae bacterium]|nr:HD domain-containing protein [Anaerolineae bacterium]
MINDLRGRVRQTGQFLGAWVRPVSTAQAAPYLSEQEMALFVQMRRPEQQHHLRVLNDLLCNGYTHPALLKAALLHDVGKTRYPFGLGARVMVVLVKKFWPARFATWSQGSPQGWRRPFVVSAQHPAWSAEMARAAGSDGLTQELIARHQEKHSSTSDAEFAGLLSVLQAADDRS